MKFLTSFVPLAVFVATAASIPMQRRDVPEDLIPQFGFNAGVNPDGTGNCDGAVNDASGKPIKIPCACPPDRQTFVNDLNANVAQGSATNNPSVQVSFPTDNSTASQLARINAASITLQNLNGPGKGCPVVSTTFQAQAKAIQDGTAPPPSAAAPAPAPAASSSAAPAPAAPAAQAPAPAPSASASASGGALNAQNIAASAPQIGFTAGKNPKGNGNCDGAVNGANGQPIQIPCSCPPDQDTFNQHLVGDALVGHAVNNPSVSVTYTLGDSVQDQLNRVNTALVTMQNLFGPGKGCPAVSTTFSAQQAALQKQL